MAGFPRRSCGCHGAWPMPEAMRCKPAKSMVSETLIEEKPAGLAAPRPILPGKRRGAASCRRARHAKRQGRRTSAHLPGGDVEKRPSRFSGGGSGTDPSTFNVLRHSPHPKNASRWLAFFDLPSGMGFVAHDQDVCMPCTRSGAKVRGEVGPDDTDLRAVLSGFETNHTSIHKLSIPAS